MQKWSIEQQKVLQSHPDFYHEAVRANEVTAQIDQWTIQSLNSGFVLVLAAQLLVIVSLFGIILHGAPYIPEVVAAVEAAAIVYAWTTVQRYYKARGMCYGIQMDVNAVKIYNEHTENNDNGGESGSPNTGGNAGNSNFRRRQDD